MAFNTPKWPSPRLCSSLLYAYCSIKLLEQVPTKTRLCVLSIRQLSASAHWQSPVLNQVLSTFALPSTSRHELFQASTAFLYCKRQKAGRSLGTRLWWRYTVTIYERMCTHSLITHAVWDLRLDSSFPFSRHHSECISAGETTAWIASHENSLESHPAGFVLYSMNWFHAWLVHHMTLAH